MAASRVGILTDEEKQVLLDRYLDIVWCEDVSEVDCVRSHRVPIHHYLSNCQHLFCKNCKNVFSDGGRWRCPQCNQHVTQLNDQDWKLEEQIYQFKVHCPNKKYGCPYQGQLKTIPGHVRSCKDTREAALPVEIREPALYTVTDQIMRLNEAVGTMRSEAKETCKRTETTEAQCKELLNRIKVLTEELNEQTEQSANVKRELKEREARDAVEIQHLRSRLEEQETLTEVLTQQLKEQKRESAKVEQILKGVVEREARDAVEMQQLQQQHTLMDTKITQDSQQLTNVSANIGEMQVAFKGLKVMWETKWRDAEKPMDNFNKDLNGHKQGLVAIKDKESKDALEMQQLSSQVQQQQSLMDKRFEQVIKDLSRVVFQINKCEVHLNGMRMVMGQTQMPHDQLHSMTLVYEWNIKTDERGRIVGTRESEVLPLTGYHYGAKANIDTYGLTNLQLIDYTQTKRPIDTRSMPRVTWVYVSQSHDTQGKKQLSNFF